MPFLAPCPAPGTRGACDRSGTRRWPRSVLLFGGHDPGTHTWHSLSGPAGELVVSSCMYVCMYVCMYYFHGRPASSVVITAQSPGQLTKHAETIPRQVHNYKTDIWQSRTHIANTQLIRSATYRVQCILFDHTAYKVPYGRDAPDLSWSRGCILNTRDSR